MKERQYIARRSAEWEAWDRWLAAEGPHAVAPEGDSPGVAGLPQRFRRLCHDLALVHDRHYSTALVEELHRRVLAAHQRIYGAGEPQGQTWRYFLGAGLPLLVRSEWRLVLAAALLLLLPLLVCLLAIQGWPDVAFLLLPPETVGEIEEMYAPTASHPGRPRAASSDWAMWGFYIANNVRIDFQAFAGGIAFGLGSVFYLVYNGLYIGAVAGHLTQIGYVTSFWGFVAGHGAFELTGVILSGSAGLKLGAALVAPGRRARLAALKENARVAVKLLYGAALLTFAAAFIEAFWSPLHGVTFEIKVGVGITLWLLTWAYLLLAGRSAPRAA
ncbi:MAG: stage II sporulation protein M [Candidatus Accumulibacter sp.]|uniref:stage II sporulation protein M n=1 Tax=Accumulibacter sp. TaxID=2053492 RepID=UPI001A5EAB7D|nr:stage II sporulation protein M [Accumulibacter sp.]MBL8393165.1 stage II sporulation protein M [Accumulibacter sp.]